MLRRVHYVSMILSVYLVQFRFVVLTQKSINRRGELCSASPSTSTVPEYKISMTENTGPEYIFIETCNFSVYSKEKDRVMLCLCFYTRVPAPVMGLHV